MIHFETSSTKGGLFSIFFSNADKVFKSKAVCVEEEGFIFSGEEFFYYFYFYLYSERDSCRVKLWVWLGLQPNGPPQGGFFL